MKKIFLFLMFTIFLQAQEHNIWYFGSYAGLDFNGGAPVALSDSQLNTVEGSASIADSNGNLLFYTDGVTVWNKNHEIMDNGQGLTGHSSSIQSALIVPKPGSSSLYYIFTTTAGGYQDGLRYSVVDMDTTGGLGSVIDKNILLHTPTSEALTATWHNNGEDIWVVTHNYNSNMFSAYLVTSGGVNTSPVTTALGHTVSSNGHACMKISPDGSKLALAIQDMIQYGTQLFNFNNETGILSEPITLSGGNNYSVEFSPSGNILYTSNISKLYQYDLQASDIGASAIEIYAVSNTAMVGGIGSLQTAPDNKIYVAGMGMATLSVINNPDVLGFDCNFTANAVSLAGTGFHLSSFGLPNNVLPPLFRVSFTANTICVGQETTFSMSSGSAQPEHMLWEFGDGNTSNEQNPTHTYHAAGSYTVRLTAQRQGIIRTVENTVMVSQVPQINTPPDMVLCDTNSNGETQFNLELQNASILESLNPDPYTITYHASANEAETGTDSLPVNFTNFSNPQEIYARVQDNSTGCYATTSFKLVIAPTPVIDMPDSYTFCENSSVLLTAPQGFDTYLWSTGESTRAIRVAEEGNYTITVTQAHEGSLCEATKTITVYQSAAPEIIRVDSSDWTSSQNTITVSVSGTGNYEYSIDGIHFQDSPEFTGLQSGVYTVFVRDKDGCGTDRKEITLLMYPKFFTPNGDGLHDTWAVKHAWAEPGMMVHIFDRYGKRLATFRGDSAGWDGKYNGNNLPATDYWFLVERQDGRQYKGHFSMVR